MKTFLNIFLLGLTFGWGPCLVSCGPLLLSYVAGAKKDSLKGITTYLLFSISRIFVYLVLGLLVFFLGRFVFEHLVNFFKVSLIAGGVFVILMAILMFLGKSINLPACSFLHKHILEKDKKSVITLGLVSGLMPCAPLVTILIYAGLISRNPVENLIYTFVFGLGTSLSPLIILVALAGLIPKLMANVKESHVRFFNLICALIMIFLGIQLIQRGI